MKKSTATGLGGLIGLVLVVVAIALIVLGDTALLMFTLGSVHNDISSAVPASAFWDCFWPAFWGTWLVGGGISASIMASAATKRS